jgi:hypothetical protein
VRVKPHGLSGAKTAAKVVLESRISEVYPGEIVPLGYTRKVLAFLWLPDYQLVLDSGWEMILHVCTSSPVSVRRTI